MKPTEWLVVAVVGAVFALDLALGGFAWRTVDVPMGLLLALAVLTGYVFGRRSVELQAPPLHGAPPRSPRPRAEVVRFTGSFPGKGGTAALVAFVLLAGTAHAQGLALPAPAPTPTPEPPRATVFGGAMVVVTTDESIVRPMGAVEFDAPIMQTETRIRLTGGITTAPGETTITAKSFHFYGVLAEGQLYREFDNLKVGALFGYVTRLQSGGNVPEQKDYVRYGVSFGVGSRKAEAFVTYGHDGIISPDFRWGDFMVRGRVSLSGAPAIWLFADTTVAVQSGLDRNVYRFGIALDCGRALGDVFGKKAASP